MRSFRLCRVKEFFAALEASGGNACVVDGVLGIAVAKVNLGSIVGRSRMRA
jgi:hypothetical protein